MEIKGVIKSIGETQQVSDKFKKRDLVLVDNSNAQYPQTILFQMTQDRCNLADNFSEGQEVTIHFNLRGKEYANDIGVVKYFNSLEAWKIIGNEAKRPAESPSPQNQNAEDYLPFN